MLLRNTASAARYSGAAIHAAPREVTSDCGSRGNTDFVRPATCVRSSSYKRLTAWAATTGVCGLGATRLTVAKTGPHWPTHEPEATSLTLRCQRAGGFLRPSALSLQRSATTESARRRHRRCKSLPWSCVRGNRGCRSPRPGCCVAVAVSDLPVVHPRPKHERVKLFSCALWAQATRSSTSGRPR